MQYIDDKPELLIELIKLRLSSKDVYSNPDKAALVHAEVRLNDLFKKLQKNDPTFSAQNVYEKLINKHQSNIHDLAQILIKEPMDTTAAQREWKKLIDQGHIPKEFTNCPPASMLSKLQLVVANNILNDLLHIQINATVHGAGRVTQLYVLSVFPPPTRELRNQYWKLAKFNFG